MSYIMDGYQTEKYFDEIEKDKKFKTYMTSTSGTSLSKTTNPPALVGWICPVCGAGLAPWVSKCPCQDKWKITY